MSIFKTAKAAPVAKLVEADSAASLVPVPERRRTPPAVTKEGVPYTALAPDLIVNMSEDRRRELHLNGRTFSHVAETTEGRWIYRCDK